ncbi:MAG: ketopantoate reductase C-terminal domain-containing protein, partial [Heliobacteriaceae bacterium]|nr:ketopantoate reductase C-terminal domain-containing protein [Heliobacteriaceae bacterium]
FGELDGRLSPRLHNLVAVFDRAGLNPEASTEPLKLIWDKLFVNVGINALTAIANVKNGQLLAIPPLTKLLEQAVTEANQVATKAGVKFSPDPVSRTKEIARLTATNISSMRQDILQGRPTEVAMMNEAIIRLGHHYGVPTPVNETLTYLVQALTARDAAKTEKPAG